MGARNVSACYALWQDLNDAPFRLLCGMALHTLDEPTERTPARRYFAGRDALHELVRDGGRASDTRSRAARAALAELVRVGAVSVVVKGAPGRRAEYALNLSPIANVGDSPAHVGEAPSKRPQSDVGDSPAHERGRVTRRNVGDSPAVDVGDSPAYPGTTEEPQKSHQEENLSSLHHVPARAGTSGDENQGDSDPTTNTWTTESELYDAANAYLVQRVGVERAGQATADYLTHHPDAGHTNAVVTLARKNGWIAA